MNLKNKINNSNTISIIKYGNGFKYIFYATLASSIVTFFDIKTISLVPGLLDSISNQEISKGGSNFVLFALISGCSRIFLSFIGTQINVKVSSNISNKIISCTNKINLYDLENFGLSNLSQVFSNDIQTINNELIYPSSLILAVSITIFLLIKIPFITILISFIYCFLYSFFIKTSKSKIRKNSQRTALIKSRFVQSASELIISARYFKNSLRGQKVNKFLKENDLRIKRMSAQNNFLSVYPKYIAETFGLIAISVIGLISSYSGNIEILSILGILALSIQKIIPSFQNIFVAISAINCNSANIARMNNLLKLSQKVWESSSNSLIIKRIGKIEKISAKSNLNKSKILIYARLNSSKLKSKNINFELRNNEWTGIIGASGSGKTTFMDLITGLAFPLKDKNKLNTNRGDLVLEINKKIKFIYLSQFNYIPSCSIIEYITNSDDKTFLNKNKNFVLSLLKTSGLFEEFDFHNIKDLNSNLSENASSISGGQAQRLNILRTIFEINSISNDSYKVLAMDEPFKGLDSFSKEKCIKLLKENSSTAVFISHSLKEAKTLCNSYYRVS